MELGICSGHMTGCDHGTWIVQADGCGKSRCARRTANEACFFWSVQPLRFEGLRSTRHIHHLFWFPLPDL